jgi:hypothetical protein
MSEALRYGVFQLAQIWWVGGGDQQRLGFPTREQAMVAVREMASVHRAFGADCEVLIQEEDGRITSMNFADPMEPSFAPWA